MQEIRENGTIGMCPLCLEEIPPIKAQQECKRVIDMVVMMCCGVGNFSEQSRSLLGDIYQKEVSIDDRIRK
jgi:hypothetical protein